MKVERQRDEECMLVTIAALSGKPLADIRRMACKHARVNKWVDVLATNRYWTTVNYVVRQLRVRGIPRILAYAPRAPQTLPSGRGSIAVMACGVSHIMPFENGLLYDTDGNEPLTLKEYRAQNLFIKILKITKARN